MLFQPSLNFPSTSSTQTPPPTAQRQYMCITANNVSFSSKKKGLLLNW